MKLLDICETIVDCPHSTAKDEGTGYPLIRTPNVGKGRLKLAGVHRVSENVYNQRNERAVPQVDDLILAREAPVGNVAIIRKGQQVCLGQRTVLIRPNKKYVDPDYLVYYLLSPELQHKLLSSANGATVSHLNMSSIRSLEVQVPEIEVQKRIGAILARIDDKIELNSTINENLEQQAQALFKAWFVDFEPFGGAMPDDWTETTLGTIAAISTKSINPLKQPDLYLEHYSIPAYDEQHYPVFEYASEVKSNKYILTNNSVMISKLNPDTKRIWRPLCLSANPVCSTEFIVYEAVNPKYKDYIYSLIDSQAFSDYLCAHTTGSTNSRQRATPKTTLDYTCIMPSDDIITRFCGIVTPMYDQIASNIIESQRLAALRDTLLPKLMNGEIDVSAVRI